MLPFSLLLVMLFFQRQQTVAAQQQQQQGRILKALVDQTCLQSCYIVDCPNLDPACVCSVVAKDETASKECSDQQCNQPSQQGAFQELLTECQARAGELGVVFDGGTGAVPPDDLGGTTPTPATTLATVTSAGTSTSATATAIATDSASGPTSTPSSETSATHTSNHSSSGSSYHSSSSDHSSDSEHDSASTEGSSSKRTSPAIIATAVVVTLVALGFLGGFFFWRRRKQRLKRLSINTFIDKYEPQIGGPLDARREKLPDFLNDILRANESPGIITGGPPVAASSSAQEPNPPNPPQNPFRSPGASPKPPPSMVSRGLPAFPKPRSRSGDVPPVPTIPPSPQPTRTAATTPATRTQSVLSAISEVSLGGNSPNTQVELRMAYQALKREVGARDDVESEWGGTTVISQDAGALSRRGF